MYSFIIILKSIKYLWRYTTCNIYYAFETAIDCNDIECVKKMLGYGIDLNKKSKNTQSMIESAIIAKNKDIVKTLLDHGANINYDADYGHSILHLAAANNACDITHIILEKHTELINMGNCIRETPLHIAALNGHNNVIAILLDHGAYINAMNYFDHTPIESAILADYVDTVEYLLNRGAIDDDLKSLVLPDNQAMLSVLTNNNVYRHLKNMKIGITLFDINEYLKTEYMSIKRKCNFKNIDDKISIFKQYVYSIQLAKQYKKEYLTQNAVSDHDVIDLLHSKYYFFEKPSSPVIRLKTLAFFTILKMKSTNDKFSIDTLPQTLGTELKDVLELLGEL